MIIIFLLICEIITECFYVQPGIKYSYVDIFKQNKYWYVDFCYNNKYDSIMNIKIDGKKEINENLLIKIRKDNSIIYEFDIDQYPHEIKIDLFKNSFYRIRVIRNFHEILDKGEFSFTKTKIKNKIKNKKTLGTEIFLILLTTCVCCMTILFSLLILKKLKSLI